MNPTNEPAIEKSRILLVEDDDFLRSALSDTLNAEGYSTDRLSSGEKVIQHLQKTHYAVMLLDLILPNKNGFEILRDMKKLKIKTPVLVFTNLSQIKDKDEAMALGAKAYYVKSNLSIDDVVDKVRQFAR